MSFTWIGRTTRAMQEDIAEQKTNEATQANQASGVDYADGDWIAMTVGQFIQILVDSGPAYSEAILFRVVEDTRVDDKSFMRQMEVLQVPSGAVAQQINKRIARVHKILAGLLQRGLIK